MSQQGAGYKLVTIDKVNPYSCKYNKLFTSQDQFLRCQLPSQNMTVGQLVKFLHPTSVLV
jgi:hypothetical protein